MHKVTGYHCNRVKMKETFQRLYRYSNNLVDRLDADIISDTDIILYDRDIRANQLERIHFVNRSFRVHLHRILAALFIQDICNFYVCSVQTNGFITFSDILWCSMMKNIVVLFTIIREQIFLEIDIKDKAFLQK